MLRTLFAAVAALLLVGCAAHPPDNSVAALDAQRYDPAYRATLDVLRSYGFTIDREDHRFGQITTDPLSAPSALEPWRRTNTTASQALTSTLNDQRRTVTVTFETPTPGTPGTPGSAPAPTPPAEAGGPTETSSLIPQVSSGSSPYTLRVEVLIERRQAPTQRVVGPTRGRTLYQLQAVPHELGQRHIPATYWAPLGRDPHLEQRLLTQILEKINS